MLNAAVNYLKVKEYDEAKSLLENLKENYASSAESREADKYLAEIEMYAKS
jgi:hypothetical protein